MTFTNDKLSEPYSRYTYRHMIQRNPDICLVVNQIENHTDHNLALSHKSCPIRQAFNVTDSMARLNDPSLKDGPILLPTLPSPIVENISAEGDLIGVVINMLDYRTQHISDGPNPINLQSNSCFGYLGNPFLNRLCTPAFIPSL